jgi:type II secretory pathway component PulF
VKFLYEYQDKSNKRHKGTLNAPTRADAYAALKAQGIKPIHCDEAPGFFNLLFGKGKRWLAIGVLAAVCVALAIVVGSGVLNSPQLSSVEETINAATRRQIIGDTAIVEKGIRTGWSDVFDLEGDRFLASFAIPGVPPAVRSTTEENLREALATNSSLFTLHSSLESASLEARQIRAIVAGMKREISGLLESGWTLREVGLALVQRQEREISYYERAKTEVETAAKSGTPVASVEQLLDRRNASLRKMGIRLVSMPETGE